MQTSPMRRKRTAQVVEQPQIITRKALTMNEVKDRLGFKSSHTIYKLSENRDLVSFKLGRARRFTIESVERYLAQNLPCSA